MKLIFPILILSFSLAGSASAYSVKRNTAGEIGTAMGQGIADGIRLEQERQFIREQMERQIAWEREKMEMLLKIEREKMRDQK